MYSSAIRSSSAIVIPGSSLSSSSASVPATTTPAAAISSISWADFRMITPATCPFGPWPGSDPGRVRCGQVRSRRVLHALERVLDLRPDLVDRPVGMERHEAAGDAVVLDDRLRLLVVGAEALRDHLGRVVRPVLDRCALGQPRPRNVVRQIEEEDGA